MRGIFADRKSQQIQRSDTLKAVGRLDKHAVLRVIAIQSVGVLVNKAIAKSSVHFLHKLVRQIDGRPVTPVAIFESTARFFALFKIQERADADFLNDSQVHLVTNRPELQQIRIDPELELAGQLQGVGE